MSSLESVVIVDDHSSVTSMCQNKNNNGKEELVHLWRGPDKVSLGFEDSLDGFVSKIVNIENWVLLMTTAYSLYHGEIITENYNDENKSSSASLSFKKTQFSAIDIAGNNKHAYIVTNDGQVLKMNPKDLTVVDTIVLKDDTNRCSNEYQKESNIIKVSELAVNDNSALFVTENGQLWASGNQPQIDIKSQEPKKVFFFDGQTVSNVACGDNFYVVLLKKESRILKEDTDSEEDAEVFNKSYSKYNNNVISSSVNTQQLSATQSRNSISSMSSTNKVVFCNTDNENLVSNTVDSIANGKLCTNEVLESDKDEKKKVMLLNTEAAKQFLTKQLSWVSSYSNAKDEFQMDTIDNPTSLIKQNVSSMASLVYEGVKTVGDKVVTLSRHVSGSSDVNDIKDDLNDTFEELGIEESKRAASSLINSLRSEELPRSSSGGSSEYELEQQYLNEKINLLTQAGNNILSTELWTWGDVKYGQLGVGDMINRPRPREITMLNHSAIKKVTCGSFHTLALTLDGKVYAWGRNNFMQVAHCLQVDQKSPQLFSSNFFIQLSPNEKAKDIGTGCDHSLIMMHSKLFLMGKHRSSGVMSTLEIPEAKDYVLKNIFCSNNLSCCTINDELIKPISEILTEEQIFLDETLYIYKNLIIPFQKKGFIASELNVYETMCRYHNELLSINVLNVESIWEYYNCTNKLYDIVIIKNVNEFISIYKFYFNIICDIIALNGFVQIAKLIDVVKVLSNFFKNKIKNKDTNVTNEAIIEFVLKNPLQHLSRYINIIKNLIKLNKHNERNEQLQEVLKKWEAVPKEQRRRLEEAENTKKFWEGSGKIVEQFRLPERRMIRESRSHQISLFNSSIFSSHWFILLTDVFIHITGTSYAAYLLQLLWVELLPDSDALQNAISITTPEANLILYTASPADRSEWFHALQIAIKNSLQRSTSHMPSQIRTGSFSFIKHSTYKDAIYNGQWLNGKLHGSGKLEWADNRMYVGQFHKGAIHGTGRMEMPLQGVYEGQWKDGQQNGYGIMNYINGDIYEGYFKDGLPHGHGMKKDGHFMASVASVYIGEWFCGVKQGYGVMDDIKTGEKYLGSWNNNMKHGSGLIVTLDGIYYEGMFVQDVFTGHGIMVLEDGTHYEGDFKSVGVFGGKGILTFYNEEKLEGNFSGTWNEEIKVTAILHINNKISEKSQLAEPPSFGKLCTLPDQKWKAIFRQFYQQLGIPESILSANSKSISVHQLETQKVWQHVAVIMSKSERLQRKTHYFSSSNTSLLSRRDSTDTNHDQLNKILSFDDNKLTLYAYEQIHKYLLRAFDSPHHPLGTLLNELATVYTATYGGVRVHPLLLKHAVVELRSITTRIYEAITLFFPALPKATDQCILKSNSDDNKEEKVISATAILHPIILPRVYSALFVLYALHNKKMDDAYWERLIKWNKQPTNTLLAFLGIDQKFWTNFNTSANDILFNEAIETLQQLKTTFSAVEKLIVIRNTHYQIEQAIQKRLENYKLPADELIPIFYFVVVRASVLQLGSEINFISDFMESYLMNGQIGYSFTTIMGIYNHILKEKITMDD
ncbi:PREDICTED: alsin [Ceratosolen solmsi marchali]|uniref:Alsin n=1 Tax=Ceratosolen solmsi marchali TaxID=326594 RepID=A0AAJ7DX32_9HYME|nr:PREDICTED: alsin [Ceratosolen solmsi marchali]